MRCFCTLSLSSFFCKWANLVAGRRAPLWPRFMTNLQRHSRILSGPAKNTRSPSAAADQNVGFTANRPHSGERGYTVAVRRGLRCWRMLGGLRTNTRRGRTLDARHRRRPFDEGAGRSVSEFFEHVRGLERKLVPTRTRWKTSLPRQTMGCQRQKPIGNLFTDVRPLIGVRGNVGLRIDLNFEYRTTRPNIRPRQNHDSHDVSP